jgi:hypothetical protein
MAHLDLPEVFGLPCAFATLRLCVQFFQTAGSLREIHYQKARISAGDPLPKPGSLREYQFVGAALAHRARIVSNSGIKPADAIDLPSPI